MDNIKQNSLDNLINNKELNILKAVFPLMPPNIKHVLAMYIAMKELSNAFLIIKLANIPHNFSSGNTSLDFNKIFEAAKKHLNPSEIDSIESYLNIFNTLQMVNDMSSMFDSNDADNNSSAGFNMDILKSMLSPEQSAIFDTFSNQE